MHAWERVAGMHADTRECGGWARHAGVGQVAGVHEADVGEGQQVHVGTGS